ncbi:hypothetical protein BPTFM16_00949 [Altererythrobacter insulae]|nr:hypothetical protein BPTFM16_00949 [Altererythrobacter insulae]
MSGAILALMIAGFVSFGVGAYLAATGERTIGIVLMANGLIFQALTLRQLRAAKKDHSDAG